MTPQQQETLATIDLFGPLKIGDRGIKQEVVSVLKRGGFIKLGPNGWITTTYGRKSLDAKK